MNGRKMALLTGAAGEVGRATAGRFLGAGWSVFLADRTPAVEQLAAELAVGAPGRVHASVADLGVDAEVDRIVDEAIATGVTLSFLGLIAAINHPAVAIENLDMALWDRVHRINLRANVKLISRCVPPLRQSPDAAIVLVSSFWGREGHPYFAPYCSSKAALISLTQSVAAELAPAIRVNCVAPGNIDTAMHYDALAVEARQRGISEEEMRRIEWAKIPMRRPSTTAEIAGAIHFLSTDEARYFVGATLDVNGGCRFT